MIRVLTGFSQPVALGALLAILPVLLLTLTAPAIPLFAPRTALLFVPYLLITVATGVTSLIERNRAWVILLPLLAAILSWGVIYNSESLFEQPVDFKTLSESWAPDIHSSDLIFLQRNYSLTPIFPYLDRDDNYLDKDDYQFVVSEFADQVKQHPASRVWVLSTEGLPPSPDMESALVGYRAVETLKARRIEAVLYVGDRQSSDSPVPSR